MAFVLCYAYCYTCEMLFAFNPYLVPSIKIEGVKQPICRECMAVANAVRIANGREPLEIQPGAYEAAEEC